MAKKERKAVKPAKAMVDKTSRWTVRGVPAQLQKAAGDAARARGMTLGQWLTELLDGATRESEATAASGWAAEVEDRLARLEASMAAPNAAGQSRSSDRKRPQAASEARA